MNIGIACYPTYGGSGVIATELGIALAKTGHSIHFISYAQPFRLQQYQENVFFHPVEMVHYPLFKYPPYDLALSVKMADVAEQARLDILHVHYAIPHAACACLARAMKSSKFPKVITTLHGTDITLVGVDPSYYQITKYSIEQSDGVTAVSNYLKQKTIDEFNIKNHIEVIPNFVDISRFKPIENQKLRFQFAPNNEKILIHISNFRPVKRVEDVVRIFSIVKQEIPVKLILVGEDCESVPMRRIRELGQELGVDEHIICLGQQGNIEHLLPIADLFILPSEQESFGLAALEAMSCGLPVIATNIGGIPEVVQSGETGYLSQVGDIQAMANHALTLLQDETLLTQFKKNARTRAISYFNASDIIPQYENYYREILMK
ncbi:MAG: N-acetyl-alpha-D-glucosaminyl L-malate synthase BshA [bacterium]|nr:N-acetyl-alpha-D-glucosaminyl L-malate synthase BshA [bacterium]